MRRNGEPGLLATAGLLVPASERIPEYAVDGIEDSATLMALFRDLTFWASAYLLEPCDFCYQQTGTYGRGRDRLPRNIAVPLAAVAHKIGARPFMEYAQSYALYNWTRKDQTGDLSFDNLALIRAFEGSVHEAGFILVHVAMVAHSGRLVSSVLDTLSAASDQQREAFDAALDEMLAVLQTINRVMETMWQRSSATAYNSFRTYIMGTKSQPMFPDGVIYTGVSEERRFYRGESGANDTIIPTCDNLLQLTERMPDNPLTVILRDFRQYRPLSHNEWLQFVETRAREVGVATFATSNADSTVRYLDVMDQVREFRDRHWRFTKEYILKHSRHPVATGGSPIVTWLPNQLGTVLATIASISDTVNRAALSEHMKPRFDLLAERAATQRRILQRELAELRASYPLEHQQ